MNVQWEKVLYFHRGEFDPVDDEGELKRIECECIAAHRWLLNTNPDCPFVAIERRTGG